MFRLTGTFDILAWCIFLPQMRRLDCWSATSNGGRKSINNPVKPFINTFYHYFFKLNSQPKGLDTHNEVTGWLIGYLKKFGTESL
ncbi:MAG: hypothetical protein ACM3H8_07615 [Sphingobacteriales bacterium]